MTVMSHEHGGAATLLQRLSATLGKGMNVLLDRLEDPGEVLSNAYVLGCEQLAEVLDTAYRANVARTHLEDDVGRLKQSARTLKARAREAVGVSENDLARELLARRRVVSAGVVALDAQAQDLADEEARFLKAATLFRGELESLGARKLALIELSKHTGDKSEIGRATAALREETAAARSAVERATRRLTELRQRASAVDALLASGALLDVESSPESLAAELLQARKSDEVARELDALIRARGA